MAATLFALVAVSCVALAAAFTPPAQYTAEAVMMLPYAGIAEPIRVYFDGVNNKSRTEYYEGQDVYIFRPDLFAYGTQYTVIPETNDSQLNVRSCVQTNGTADNTISIQSFLPDLSTFKLLGNVSKRGVLCEDWFYQYQGGTRTNTYHLYVEVATQTPLQYYMSGYDSLLGSHYDEYVLNYLTWTPGPIADPTVFDAPNLPCGNFPGPGAMTGDRGALALVEDPVAEEQRVEKAFSEFKTKHGKTYASEHEHVERMSIFRKNSRYISSMNRRHLSYSLAVNRFADFRHSELKAMRGSVSTRRSKGPAASVAATDLPTSWDWRDKGAVSPVKDQGICGSCWSFATAQTIESSLFLKTGKMTPLSPQSLVDCSWGFGNNGCDGGEAERAFGWILQQGGIPSEASYGVYEMADGLCHSKQAAIGASISSYVNVTSGDLNAVADALYNHGPLSIAIDAGHLSFVFYSSGVYYEPTCKSGEDDLDHAVLLIGWGVDPTDGAYWIVKNSWSEYWGDNGYVKMSQKDNNCGVATDTNYVIIQ